MLGRKVIYVRCKNCLYNNVAKGILLRDKKKTFFVNKSMSKFVKILVRFISYENRWCDHEFFFFTQYYWSYLIRLADKTEKYCCVNIFLLDSNPIFGIFARPAEKIELSTRIIKKNVIFSGILTGCIDKSIIQVNVGGFNMWFFITFFAFFCQKTSVPSVYIKTVTLDKLQKKYWIPNGAESGFLSY